MLVADTLTGDLTLHENADVAIEWDATQQLRGVSEGNARAVPSSASTAAATTMATTSVLFMPLSHLFRARAVHRMAAYSTIFFLPPPSLLSMPTTFCT